MQRNGETQVYVEAQRILRSLLIGIDPETNAQLPGDCAACRPMVKMALALGVEALETKHWMDRWKAEKDAEPQTRASYIPPEDAKESPARAGEGWSSDEDQQLTQQFSTGTKIEQMARLHQRSRGAIVSRLVYLGLMSR